MDSTHWYLQNYTKPNGRNPITEFIDSLSTEEKVYVFNDFDLLEKFGPSLGRPHVEYLDDKIYALRTRVGKVQIRSFFFCIEHKLVFTNGIRGKGKIIPNNAIKKAIEYRKDYINTDQDNEK
jgi:hypothetical protein